MSVVKKITKDNSYKKFDQLDGDHPLKKVVPNGYVDYPARIRKGGKLVYFNFDLAKEMGLIPKSHDNELNKTLENKILETFSIQIINEYDQMKNRVFDKKDMKEGTYMATRYLQLQHEDKKGRTSGDGRSIWNGQVSHGGKKWDVSSCGTGGTRLSPATSKYNKFFETGDPSISYGCGYAEIDEGFATAVFSNIFHQNDYVTERSLAIIEYKNNISINVRAHRNLIRPSHIFLYLKQDDHESLKSIVDFYIDSKRNSIGWEKCPQGKGKYNFLLKQFTKTFAELSANFEDDYIFCWLDWDGDNILMDGGIIDYGSVRQFGLCHSEYRYDDIERFSTSLMEQKSKAKYIVQAMAQSIEYITSGIKPSLQDVNDHSCLKDFEDIYEEKKKINLLHRMGFGEKKIKQLLKRNSEDIDSFKKIYQYFEQAKSHRGKVKISDGVTWDAIFSLRNFLRDFPQIYLHREDKLSAEEIIELLQTDLADQQDLELTSYRKQKLNELQTQYISLIEKAAKLFQESEEETLLKIVKRSVIINKIGRVTGDSITHIVNLFLNKRKKLSPEAIHELNQQLANYQALNPDKKVKPLKEIPKGLLNEAIQIFSDHRDGI